MTFTVTWRAEAMRQLESLWNDVADPEVLADAVDAVNGLLRDRPFELGESRSDASERVWYQWPLGVLFEIDAADAAVYVAAIEWLGRA